MTTTTTNYGWVKPDVGASDDVWGGYINTDLDGIDTIVKGVSVVANAAYPASNPSGYQTAAQVAAVVIGDNRIINGDMRIDQRNNGASGTALGYAVDRWSVGGNLAGKGSWGRNFGALAGSPGFPYYFGFSSNSNYTTATGDTLLIQQAIEADAVSDFQWGSASAQPVTLSFWAISNVVGTYGGSIRHYTGPRSYPFSFSIPTASIWTRIVITIPGDTGGSWTLSGNSGAMWLGFDIGVGSNARGPANRWASTAYLGVMGTNSVVALNGGQLYVTGVKLEIGSVATPFNRQSLAKSMADCQRYYQVGAIWTSIVAQGVGKFGTQTTLPVQMRAAPTMAFSGVASGNCSGLVPANMTDFGFISAANASAAGEAYFNANYAANAEL